MPVMCEDRDVVELGVVEAVQQMDGARPRRGEAHAEPPGRLGVAGGHEGGGLLVMDEDEPDPVLVAPQSFHDAVDAVAGQAEDRVDTPVRQSFDEHFRGDFRHRTYSVPQPGLGADEVGTTPGQGAPITPRREPSRHRLFRRYVARA